MTTAGPFSAEQVRAWRNGASGFLQWVRDIQARIPSSKGGYEICQLEPFQEQAIRDALAQDDRGNWRYTTIAFSFPRRHSKTVLCGLLVLWRFCNFQAENIVSIANSEKQTRSVGFGLVRGIVLNTPFLLSLIGRERVMRDRIELPALQNTIKTQSSNISGLYGERITCGWCSELHAAASDDAMQVLASSLGDTENSWLLIDSTVDSIGGPLHKLEQLQASGEDPTVFVARVEYADLDEALEKSPRWIRRDWLRSRAAQMLPAQFESQHLNRRGESSNALFAKAAVDACMSRLPHPFTHDDLERIAAGRNYATGGGLDRAYAFSLHGDATIWTSVAKIAGENEEEPHYYILYQQDILASLATGIKKAIVRDNKEYELSNIIIESYNSQDISTWAIDKGIPNEIVYATNNAQLPAFMELYRAVKEGRLHFSDKLKDLAREMETFVYEAKGTTAKFGCDKFRDDRVYSLAWAIHSLRQRELAAFELKSLVCASKSSHAPLCYMRGGDSMLYCSRDCPSHIHVHSMYQQYTSRNVDSDIQLQNFFKNHVKVSGARLYQS